MSLHETNLIFLFLRDEVPYVKFPKDIEDAKKLGEVLSRYKEKYFYEVSHFEKNLHESDNINRIMSIADDFIK